MLERFLVGAERSPDIAQVLETRAVIAPIDRVDEQSDLGNRVAMDLGQRVAGTD